MPDKLSRFVATSRSDEPMLPIEALAVGTGHSESTAAGVINTRFSDESKEKETGVEPTIPTTTDKSDGLKNPTFDSARHLRLEEPAEDIWSFKGHSTSKTLKGQGRLK
eukprot:jgi/Phyca11/14482/fgenesh1_pg.PHYCAscaffold_8_\